MSAAHRVGHGGLAVRDLYCYAPRGYCRVPGSGTMKRPRVSFLPSCRSDRAYPPFLRKRYGRYPACSASGTIGVRPALRAGRCWKAPLLEPQRSEPVGPRAEMDANGTAVSGECVEGGGARRRGQRHTASNGRPAVRTAPVRRLAAPRADRSRWQSGRRIDPSTPGGGPPVVDVQGGWRASPRCSALVAVVASMLTNLAYFSYI